MELVPTTANSRAISVTFSSLSFLRAASQVAPHRPSICTQHTELQSESQPEHVANPLLKQRHATAIEGTLASNKHDDSAPSATAHPPPWSARNTRKCSPRAGWKTKPGHDTVLVRVGVTRASSTTAINVLHKAQIFFFVLEFVTNPSRAANTTTRLQCKLFLTRKEDCVNERRRAHGFYRATRHPGTRQSDQCDLIDYRFEYRATFRPHETRLRN
jgi:hypothetical protein